MKAGSRKNTEILVTFDLDKEGDCYDKTSFSDDRNSQPGPGKSFDSPVDPGKKVIWRGALSNATSPRDFIKILAVFKKKPNEISLLRRDVYLGNRNGEVVARVRDNGDKILGLAREANETSAKGDVLEAYNITFLVGYLDKNGEMNYNMCTIDPKIRML